MIAHGGKQAVSGHIWMCADGWPDAEEGCSSESGLARTLLHAWTVQMPRLAKFVCAKHWILQLWAACAHVQQVYRTLAVYI